ncbi:MAG: site-specific integrase [Dysosmobacter sp.]|uniref:tyrosine-type recombinase/integrase n=1 Tax=Dysosmobacter sp. TaxID=2591382 RepID=UPI0028485830|nr:site-specific integrase [Dysosmobacter sp.]MDR3981811.1 site-specific integrase [Dysosmobacter sp.]
MRKRKDGRWEGRYTAGYDQDGKQIIKNVLCRTQAEVRAKLAVAIAESQQLDVSRSGEYTVTECLRLWFELYAKPNIRSSTASYYCRAMEEYTILRIGTIKLISIPQEAVDLLVREHAMHPNNPWLFPSSRTGAMYHPDSVSTLHQRILKDAGLEHLRFHDLRHTFATLALQNGVDIKTVSAMPGHYDAGFTLRTYTHTTRQKQDEAAQTMGNLMAQMR